MDHDDHPRDGVLHWTTALLAALLVLALAAPLISMASPLFGRAKRKPLPHQLSNSRAGKAVFSAKHVVPGQTGSGKVVISNTGTKPFRKVTLTRSSVRNGIGRGLTLQVFDASTKRCLYPAPPRKAKHPPRRCRGWGTWTGKRRLRGVAVPARHGAAWRAKERHVIQVRWRVGQDIPQGKAARFNLVWRASS